MIREDDLDSESPESFVDDLGDPASGNRFGVRELSDEEYEGQPDELEPLINRINRMLFRVPLNEELHPPKEDFQNRFIANIASHFPELPSPSPELLDATYDVAVHAWNLRHAWEVIVERLGAPEFEAVRARLSSSLEWLKAVETSAPASVSKGTDEIGNWLSVRCSSIKPELRGLKREIAGALEYLDSVGTLRRSGRTKIESIVLWIIGGQLRDVARGTPFDIQNERLRASFCDAAGLLYEPPNSDSDFVHVVTSRYDRAGRSKTLVSALSVLLSALLQSTGTDVDNSRRSEDETPLKPR